MESRWENLDVSWNDRTKKLLSLLPPFQSLLEFGQGKGNTRSLLHNIKYTGSDLYQRDEATIVCNLNDTILPSFEYHDVILMSGILEYLYDIDGVISHLAQYTNMFCISYAGADNHSVEEEIINGWKPCIFYKDLVEIFANLGFKLVNTDKWKRQQLFVFKRESTLDTWKVLQEQEYFKTHRCYQGLHLAQENMDIVEQIKDKVIVEIGCGYGRETQYFTRYAKKVYAIDVSEKILALTCETVRHHGNIDRLYPITAENFQLKINEPIDFLYSQYVFQHITPIQAKDYLTHFKPLLKGNLQILFRIGTRKEYPDLKEPLVEYTESELKELLNGFTITNIVKDETNKYKLWNITAYVS